MPACLADLLNEERGAPCILTMDEVLAIQAHQISTYGGAHGIRDVRLLDSALAMMTSSWR